jgi:phage shock protein A
MNTFRKLTTTIRSNFQWIVTQIENHDALVESAIREIRGTRAKARAQFARMQREGQRIEERRREIEKEIALWTDRARRVKDSDEATALKCLQRRKHLQTTRQQLDEQSEEHARTEEQLQHDLKTIDERLQLLQQKQHLLRARESRADALRACQAEDLDPLSDLDEIFDRWESKVLLHEASRECLSTPADTMANEFEIKEEEEYLRAELAELD